MGDFGFFYRREKEKQRYAEIGQGKSAPRHKNGDQ